MKKVKRLTKIENGESPFLTRTLSHEYPKIEEREREREPVGDQRRE